MDLIPISAIGQDSHRFEKRFHKKLILGGIEIDHPFGLAANSDGDVVLHAITNAVSGLTGINILGEIADRLCLEENITSSKVYLKEALKHLGAIRSTHLSIAIECKEPRLSSYMDAMKTSIAGILSLSEKHIGITATTGEGLTPFGRKEGISVFCILSALSPDT
jgi:2-C-methyl-D-erythritol 2,4-cyclodiphosphate synthase